MEELKVKKGKVKAEPGPIASKIRPSALWLGTLCAVLTGIFGVLFMQMVKSMMGADADDVTPDKVALALALAGLTFAPLGGLLVLAGQMATDPEKNALLAYVMARLDKGKDV